MLRCPTEQTYQDARERDIVRSCCFISLVFPGKNEGQGEGGGVFVVEREKKSRKRRDLPRVLSSFPETHFSTLSREAVHAS